MVIDSDGIDQNIRFLHHRLDFALGVAAVIVPSIRDDEQRLLREFRLPHFADAQIDGIQQGRASLGNGVHQFALDVFHRLREVRNFLGFVGERDHEEFVLGVGRLEKLHYRLPRPLDFAAHAATHIEDYAQRHGCILAGKMLDLLLVLAFEDGKVILVQPGNQTV